MPASAQTVPARLTLEDALSLARQNNPALSRVHADQAVNAEGIPLRLWVDPKERGRGVEPLVKEDIPPGAVRDYRKIAASELMRPTASIFSPRNIGHTGAFMLDLGWGGGALGSAGHPIHFGMVCVVASAIGHITPPVGLCLFVGMAISGLPMEQLVRPLLPFIAAIVVVLLLVAFVPETVLLVPRRLGFIP